jgi:hypothetical protein
MSNAWLYYILVVAICCAFILGGLAVVGTVAAVLRFALGKKLGISWKVIAPVLAFLGVWGIAVVLLVLPSPSQRERQFRGIFHTPTARIDRFVIQAGGKYDYKPLSASRVVISDPGQIGRIAAALDGARELELNHPRAKWTAHVEMETRDGTYFFEVNATIPGDENGTVVSVWSARGGTGWHYGSFRVDGLDTALEDAVGAAGGP